jgi:hypothetical protein
VPARSRPVSCTQLSNRTRRRRREMLKNGREKEERKSLCACIWLGLGWDRTENDRMMTTNKLYILCSLAFVRRKWLMMLLCVTDDVSYSFIVVRTFFFCLTILSSFLIDHLTKERITEECESTEDGGKKKECTVSSKC